MFNSRGVSHGLALLALLLVPILWQDMPVVGAMRLAWLDGYQELSPRERRSAPAVIVAIDEVSLDRFGQWPWPRTLIAQLIDKIGAARPAAIGVDILFPEPDRLSPEWLAPSVAGAEPQLAARLAKLPRHDALLAASINAAPVVLGIAGLEAGKPSEAAPLTPSLQRGSDARTALRQYASTLRSLPEIDVAARGHGLLSADTEAGVVRRVPIVALVGTTPVLPLSLETLRLASGEPLFFVQGGVAGVEAVGIGDLTVPTQADGRLWVHYTPHDASRFISAADVLGEKADPAQLEGKLVLVGVTGLGLIDYRTTPLGERMPGIEIHAQVLENVFDGALLMRPRWATWAEGLALLVAGLIVVCSVPRLSPGRSTVLLLLLLITLGATGFGAYRVAGLLLDASVPGAAIAFLFAAMLVETLAEANAQKKLLQERLQREREAAARLAGELDAARRIQVGSLPRPESAFPSEHRFEISAAMEPAREVGGDLYDFFMLDPEHLFFLVGDVSGKGLPASIFMAVSKALCKSAALRRGRRVDELLREANAEIARENPESLFVTVFAAVLDVPSGRLEYCSAGHEAPFVLTPDGEIARLEEGGGPPLCVLEGFSYVAAEHRMSRGGIICVVSDGVTEAMNQAGELYGAGRLREALEHARNVESPGALVNSIRADIAQFVDGAEAADDLTLLVLRWNGS
ncbi:MAG: CHASE2 domain-containing protein [Betaproteobacteria bacterium]|nr:MAG: CHASE2 domain-containing protein [Betaproteobacteria bacterium]